MTFFLLISLDLVFRKPLFLNFLLRFDQLRRFKLPRLTIRHLWIIIHDSSIIQPWLMASHPENHSVIMAWFPWVMDYNG